MQAADWLLRLQASPSDLDLKKDFERWLEESDANRVAYQKVRFISATARAGGRGAASLDDVPPLPARWRHRRRWIGIGAALAAAACLALVAFPVLQKHILADYVTGVAQLREIGLPDGSVAFLDAGSAIAVDYREHSREITLLEGQAFFQVSRSIERPFKVAAGKLAVVVTGTAFGVRMAPHSISVAVESGTVEVTMPGRVARTVLTAGESISYRGDTGEASARAVDPATIASWRSRRLMVYETRFEDILDEIERHLPGRVIVRDKSLNGQLVTGAFDLSNPQESLEALAASQRASLTQITPYLVILSTR